MKKIIFLFLISFVFIINISALSNTKVGSVSLTKTDSEKINRKEATLEGAIYGIYDKNNELITTLTTDINGKAFVDNIPYGTYFLKEISPSKGYKLTLGSHTLMINDSVPKWYVYSSEKVIKGNLIINKYYGEEENYKLEEGAEFEIHDIDNELVGNYKTEEGKLEVVLPYGTYKVIQVSGVEGYTLIDSFEVKIEEEKDYIYDLYNNQIKGNLIINKYYGEEENYKLEEAAEFEIYNIDNELVGNYKIKEGKLEVVLPYGTYKVIQISGVEGYALIDSFEIKIEEEKNYIHDLYSKKIKEEIDDEFINDDVPKIDIEEYEPEIDKEENEEVKIETNEEIIPEIKEETSLEIEEEKNEDILIVEVPDTYEFNYNKIIIFLLIIIGIIFVLIGIKKLRN